MIRIQLKFCFGILFFLISVGVSSGQCIKMATWNIQDLGQTKDEDEIRIIAETLRHFDFVAIQEVVAIHPAGAQKVAAIVSELDRMGTNWDYKISNPTSHHVPQSRERYAFLWKRSKIELLAAKLDVDNEAVIVREPYLAKLKLKESGKVFWVANFHSLPHNKHPEEEIRILASYFPAALPHPLILMGDWNVDERHSVWRDFAAFSLRPVVVNAPTTIKRACKNGNYLNHAIDNIYYTADNLTFTKSGVSDFIGSCENLAIARGVSDHLVVWGEGCF